MDPNNILAIPVARDLARQTVAKARDKNGNHLWPRVHDQLPYPWLRTQVRIRIVTFIARSLGMETDDVAWPCTRKLGEYVKRELIERTLLGNRMIAGGKERRI